MTRDVQRLVKLGHKPECVNCGSKTHLTVDHIKPKSKGGGRTLDNLQIMCRKCNSGKGNAEYKVVKNPEYLSRTELSLGTRKILFD